MSNSTASADLLRATFGYEASMPMAWLGGIIFTLAFFLHVFQYIHHKAWYLYLFMLGIAMELCGYWTRVLSIKQPDNGAAASSTYALTVLAPSFLAAGLYMTFGRMIYWVAPEENRTFKHILLPAKWITTIFVSFDFASFIIACIGVIVLYVNATKADLSDDQRASGIMMTYSILRVAFVWQLIVFSVFNIVSFRFMFHSKVWKYDWPEGITKWRKMGWMANGANLAIVARSLYRLLSFTLNGGDNYLKSNEWTFYMFDFVPMVAVVVLFNFFHPGKFMPQDYMTIGHAFKKPGFRPAAETKEIEEQPTAGYSRVTLVPPPLNPPTHKPSQSQDTGVAFSDPWNNRSSSSAARY